MTFKNTTQCILARVYPPRPRKSTKRSQRLLDQSSHNVLQDVEGSSGGLDMGIGFIDLSNYCGMSVHKLRQGVNFCRHAPQLGYHRNVPWANHRNQNLLLWSRLTALYFLKVWRRSIQALWWKHRRHAYFGHVYIHSPMQMSKISWVTGPKFMKFWTDVDVIATIGFAIFPSVVKFQHKQ